MRAELDKADPSVFFLLKLTINGTSYRYGEVGLIYPSDGMYEAKIESWGVVERGVNVRTNALEFNKVDVVLRDEDQTFTAVVEGEDRNTLRSSTATIIMASPNVSSSNWATVFSGRIDQIAQPDYLKWTVSLSPNDLPLQRESVPKTKVSRADFPSCDVDVEGEVVPILYGRISSKNDTNTGALPTLFVDSGNSRYLIAAGWVKTVLAVYVDGVAAIETTDYTIIRPVINGRQYTLVEFVESQGDATITCDAEGYDTNGDGTGSLIVDPPSQMEHALHNWIYGDYRQGSWLTGGPVDATTFGATFFSDRDYEGSLYLNKKQTGTSVINSFLQTFEAKAYWTHDGDIALGVQDFTTASYVTALVVQKDEISGWNLSYPTVSIYDRINATYANYPNGGYSQYLNVVDLSIGEDAPESLALPFSPCFMLS